MKTPQLPSARQTGPLTAFARNTLFKRLAPLSRGAITLIEGEEHRTFGQSGAPLHATLRIHDRAFFKRAVFGGSIGIAEAYMDGLWDCDDLTTLFRIMVLNRTARDNLEQGFARFALFLWSISYRLRANTRSGSRRNIAAHYDLGNELYKLFLDPTLAYSCGFFPSANATMEEASIAKFDMICKKLRLTPDTRLVEIGTGWGGFAIHAASRYGCSITTTTISSQQYELAARRISEAGLGDRITLLKQDYRDLEGQYDRLVSIEMIEAVGARFLSDYFRACCRLLKPDGLALIQAISVPDRIFDDYAKNPEFINTYIFPGGCCPSVGAMSHAVATCTDLRLIHFQDLTPHYVRTLQAWRKTFLANEKAIRALGYDDRFIRMWLYYLCYCEGAFAEQFTTDAQLLYARPDYRTTGD